MVRKPLLWSTRCAAALGLAALTMTGEVMALYVCAGWAAWAASVFLDEYPGWGEAVRRFETAAAFGLMAAFSAYFFVLNQSIFISLANVLLLFQILKLLGPKTRKDCLQILMFGFFHILSACTLAVGLWHGLTFLVLIPTAAAGLFWLNLSREEESSNQRIPESLRRSYHRLALFMSGASLPCVVVLAGGVFVAFPRISLNAAFPGFGSRTIGYTDRVDLGKTGTLQQDTSTVLWLQIVPDRDRSLWDGHLRGSTMDSFDGKKWAHTVSGGARSLRSGGSGYFTLTELEKKAKTLQQTIILVDTSASVLFAAPQPYQVQAPLPMLHIDGDGTLRWTGDRWKPLRYEVLSQVGLLKKGKEEVAGPSSPYLQLPDISLQATRALAASLSKGLPPYKQAKAMEAYLRSRYHYTLDLGSRVPDNPVEEFLFRRKKGHCEYFASAMAVMLRLQGIPSRVAAGFLQGEWNALSGQYLIRASDAHAWVEAYFEGLGWVTFDPSPRQMELSSTNRWVAKLKEYWAYWNYHWIRVVIEYDLYSQLKILHEMQRASNRMNELLSAMWNDRAWQLNTHFKRSPFRSFKERFQGMRLRSIFLGVCLAIALASLQKLWRFQRLPCDSEVAFYLQFLQKMARAGFPKAPHETGWEFAQRLARDSSNPVPGSFELTERYYSIRFGQTRG